MASKKRQGSATAAEVDIDEDEMMIEGDDEDSVAGGEQAQATTSYKPLSIQKQDSDPTNATYSFYNEDHTLGNVLRNVLIKNKSVEFCAYSVPHPSEPLMNLRI